MFKLFFVKPSFLSLVFFLLLNLCEITVDVFDIAPFFSKRLSDLTILDIHNFNLTALCLNCSLRNPSFLSLVFFLLLFLCEITVDGFEIAPFFSKRLSEPHSFCYSKLQLNCFMFKLFFVKPSFLSLVFFLRIFFVKSQWWIRDSTILF